MAFSFNNCLTQQGSGTNYMYGECCCDFECTVTTDEAVTIQSLAVGFINELFTISGGNEIYINGVLQTLPLALNIGDSFQIPFQICAGMLGDTDTLVFNFGYSTGVQKIYFDFEAIDLSTSVTPTTLNFGNVIIGQTGTLNLQIQNPTVCCYEYDLTTTCPETAITPSLSNLLCSGNQQSGIKVDFTPTIVGSINCQVFVSVGCQSWSIDVTGNAINPPSGGGTTPTQKNKVDQTTRVEACSPRTANNRCQTAKTMQSAIRSNARRFGKR